MALDRPKPPEKKTKSERFAEAFGRAVNTPDERALPDRPRKVRLEDLPDED